MRISRLLAPVTALGPGRRVGLWVQGCDLACRGCASSDTWDPRAGTELEVETVAERVLAEIRDHDLTGLTISGGEPFQQPEAVAAVVRAVREAEPHIDILVFTGYAPSVARRRSPTLVDGLDILVAGRYDESRPRGGPLVSSDNQEVVLLTDLGRERFAEVAGPWLQVAATEDRLFVLGLPHAGDLRRLEHELATAGVRLEEVSWRA